LMYGKLISSDMLTTFKDHVTKQLDEGSGHHIRQME